jgi:2-polyprenyl-3-methyl-5-hydroxy-6-metoxy-1,4-benzoquinol methylase
MRHVFEHLLYPEKTLSKIRKTLSDKGHLYIAIPNLNCSESIITRNFFRVVHTLYFSKKNLKFILENNGFSIVKIITKSDGEIYAICKKTKITKKKPSFNDYALSRNKLLRLWVRWE